MNIKNLVAVAVVWLLSLVGVAVWAQVNPPGSDWKIVTKDGQVLAQGAQIGTVVAGDDIGFRVTGDAKGKVVGRMVVKINGQWRDASFEVGVTR